MVATVEQVAQAVGAMGLPVAVGCASGADQVVRSLISHATVFRVQGSSRQAFALRSIQLVSAVKASQGWRAVVAFPASPCPAGLVPSSSSHQCFSGKGSGTWATAALAAGLGVPVVVFGSVALPQWGGTWALVLNGPLAGGFVFRSSQGSLF